MQTPLANARAPWHLWGVGILGVFWNGFGAYDYLMSHIDPDAYMRSVGMTDAQIALITEMPAWMTAVWAIGVWGAVLGTVLLLLRQRAAFHAFAFSLAALVLSLVFHYLLTNASALMGTTGLVMNLVVLVGAVGFLMYAWAMRKRAVLR